MQICMRLVPGDECSMQLLLEAHSLYEPGSVVLTRNASNCSHRGDPFMVQNEHAKAACAESRMYEKIGEATEVALHVLVEKLGHPNEGSGVDRYSEDCKERATFFKTYWHEEFRKVRSVPDIISCFCLLVHASDPGFTSHSQEGLLTGIYIQITSQMWVLSRRGEENSSTQRQLTVTSCFGISRGVDIDSLHICECSRGSKGDDSCTQRKET